MKLLAETRGESLMESLMALLVFAILVATVTSMILVSLRITESSIREAEIMQGHINTLNQGSGGESDEIRLNGVRVDISVRESGGFIIFEPR